MMKPWLIAFLVLGSIIISSCRGSLHDLGVNPGNDSVDRPEGWTELSHEDEVISYDVVFPQTEVSRVDITISSENWLAMSNDMAVNLGYGAFGGGGGLPGPPAPPGTTSSEEPMWVPCTWEFNGVQWNYTGIRFKGNSTLRDTWQSGIYKLPFRLDFDEFEDAYPEIDDQRFYGFKKLTLSSACKDMSLMREKIAADIFRAAGVPAPRTAFYRIYIDHGSGPVFFGLYTMVEVPEDPMLELQFTSDGGNLYKPEGTGAAFTTFDTVSFEKDSNEDEADWSDIISVFDALHADRSDAALWRSGLDQVFNTEGFLRWLAVNTTIQNWDTYGKMTHNYYLYNDPGDGLIHWIPWDNNEALNAATPQTPLSLQLTEVGTSWPLIRYLVDDAVYYSQYTNSIRQLIDGVFAPAAIKAVYQQEYNLIEEYVTGINGEIAGHTFLSSPADFANELTYLMNHADSRYAAAVALVP